MHAKVNIKCKQLLNHQESIGNVPLMARTKRPPSSVRLWGENAEALESVAALGLNCSEVVNEALQENLRRFADKRVKTLQRALAEQA